MKNLIVFNTDKLNDFVRNRYDVLVNSISSNSYDIYFQVPNYLSTDSIQATKILRYSDSLISKMNCTIAYNLVNIIKPLCEDYIENEDNYKEYNNIYIIDYSIYCNKSWSTLFNLLNSDTYANIDLLINNAKISEDNSWMWTSIYKNSDEIIKDDSFKRLLSSYIDGFIKISNKALDFYAKYNKTNVKDYFIDFSLPTILYNYGFTVKSLSNVDDSEFNCLNICKQDSFGYGLSPKKIEQMNSMYNDLTLFNNYNESIGFEYNHIIDNPEISVIIYCDDKNTDYDKIKKCINSVFNQNINEKYEILFIDDSSNNNVKDFIINNNYNENEKFIYIKTTNYGLINGINHGLYNAIGNYCVIINCYDILPFYRLNEGFRKSKELNAKCIYSLSLNDKNKIYNNLYNKELLNVKLLKELYLNKYQNLFISRDILINKMPYMFEEYYINNETYALLFNLLFNNIDIYLDNAVVCYSSDICYNVIDKRTNESKYRVDHLIDYYLNKHNFKEEKNLTVIVSFKDEKHEVEKTLSSIRATTNNLPIILVNDGSDDNYNYYNLVKKYNVRYLENNISSGVAGARENAISLIKTDYFMLLDGHMRFYEHDWDDRVLNIIKEGNHHNDILVAQTLCFWKLDKLLYNNEKGYENSTCFGATLNDNTYTNNPYWTWTCYDESMKNDNVVITPCILGACYIISKDHWKHIGGLTGLLQWGQDEPLLSIKTWLSGNKCCVIRDFKVGHLYRDSTPYARDIPEMNSNYIYLNYLFYEGEQLENKLNQLKKFFGEQAYNNALNIFMNRKKEFDEFKKYFDEKVKVHPIEYFDEINLKCKDKHN